MASIARTSRASTPFRFLLRQTATTTRPLHQQLQSLTLPVRQAYKLQNQVEYTKPIQTSLFHTTCHPQRGRSGDSGETPPTDFGALDVLGNLPVPSTSVDICMSSGFQLNNGTRVTDGSGVLLVGGEAFKWRPWEAASASASASTPPPADEFRLVNAKSQFSIPPAALGLLARLWPRPDLLILGVGPQNRPLSPELRRQIARLAMRVEVLDTRNAAAQFNMLATERGVEDVAAALIPIGWVEGLGAGTGDDPTLTHD